MMGDALPEIDRGRLWSRLMELANIGATGVPGEVNRQALSDEDAQVAAKVIAWGREAGLLPSLDQAGNLFLTLEGTDPGLPTILGGSHLDSQPTGGRFDGTIGVLAALEAVALLADGVRPAHPVAVVAWCNEEGSRFAPGMSGSAAFAGVLGVEDVRGFRDASGTTLGEALDRFATSLGLEKQPAGFPVAGYVELHIEQGPVLEAAGLIIGAVTGIKGKKTWEVVLRGRKAHAGTQPMAQRQDALASFVRVGGVLHFGVTSAAPEAMFTIGRLEVSPNAPSVIPDEARFRIDLRHADGKILEKLGALVETEILANAAPCVAEITQLVDAPPNAFAPDLRRSILSSATQRGLPAAELLSAAGHDARHMAPLAPSAMVFVPCRNGLSHHPDEWAEPDHVAAGAQVVADVLYHLAHGRN